MKKLGFLFISALLTLSVSAHSMSINIPNLTSYDFNAPPDVNGEPPKTSIASIDLHFDKKSDANPDPFIYEFDSAFTQISVNLSAYINGIWEDQSFSLNSTSGNGHFQLDETNSGEALIHVSGVNFSALIVANKIDDGFAIMHVAAGIYNFEYFSEDATLNLSQFDVPEPSSLIILLIGFFSILVARVKMRASL